LPLACVRHCDALILYQLKVEIGASVADVEMLTINKAEIFLRQLYYSHFLVGAEGGEVASPSYGRPAERPERRLD